MAKVVKQTSKKTSTRRTTAKKTVKRSGSKSITLPTDEQIRARAFGIYLARNGGPGDAHSDWQRAERELHDELAR